MQTEKIVTKSRSRKKVNTRYDADKIVELSKTTNLTQDQIAKLHDVERSTVSKVLARYGLEKRNIDDYINNRPEILAGLQDKILQSITIDDIKKAPAAQRTMMYGILYDKERLERGQSTDNIGVIGKLIHEIKGIEHNDD